MKRLVLVGSGHAHLSVLRVLACEKPTGIEVVLISPSAYQNYSGMLPGWIAGHYNKLQCQIDLKPLVQAAHVRLVVNSITGMNANLRCVYLAESKRIEYDLLSLNVGSETDLSWLEIPQENLFPIRPLDNFIEAWPQILSFKQTKSDYRLVVVGGGGAGVELALAAQYAFTRSDANGHVDLVVSESGLLFGFANGAQRRIHKILVEAGVSVHYLRAAGTKKRVDVIEWCCVDCRLHNCRHWCQSAYLAKTLQTHARRKRIHCCRRISPKPITSKCICSRRRLFSTRFGNVTLRRSFSSRRTRAWCELASSIKKWTNDHLQTTSLFTVFAGLWTSFCSSLLGKLEHTR